MSTPVFQRASTIVHPTELPVDPDNSPLIASVLGSWEEGSVYLLEGPFTRTIHKYLHYTMLNAITRGRKTTMIDAANSFTPQHIDELAQRRRLQTTEILDSIALSRPFQMFQAASIVEKVYNLHVGKSGCLIVVTDLPPMFFDSSVEEAQDSGLSANESFHHSVGRLQRLAWSGNIVILTERAQTVDDARLGFAANVHLRFEQVADGYQTATLLSHPNSPLKTVRHRVEKTRRSVQQMSLEEFF